MKKSELKNMILESYKEILKEQEKTLPYKKGDKVITINDKTKGVVQKSGKDQTLVKTDESHAFWYQNTNLKKQSVEDTEKLKEAIKTQIRTILKEENGYIAFCTNCGNKQVEVYADTSYNAQQKATVKFQKLFPRKNIKSYMVDVMIAEKDGEPVIHSTTEI